METGGTAIETVWIVDAGAVTALGDTLEATWAGLIGGSCGIGPLVRFKTGGYSSSVGACVNDLSAPQDRSIINDLLERLFSGMRLPPSDAALITATTKFGIDNLRKHRQSEASNVDDIVPASMPDVVSRRLGLENTGVNISASCASSTIAVAQGSAMIASGAADAVLICCADIVTEFVFSGFSALKILSPSPCRPFDRDRDGISLGDGAAALLLMGEKRAKREGYPCKAVIRGWGIASDAYHITSPSPDSSGLTAAIERALTTAGLKPEDIAGISAHGTGTIYNDFMELTAIGQVFGGRKMPVYSVKGSLGHTLGAAGGLEVALAIKALEKRAVPPTIGLKNPEASAEGRVKPTPAGLDGDYLMTCNSGFGGINAVIVLERGGRS